jgi:predicted transcriptional regulator
MTVALTGETQLRARRTRIKILRAIADRNGVAGFSDIKFSTGLSTGSIYYHLERMGNYVTKDSKHYIITEDGLQLLRDVDSKYASVAAPPPPPARKVAGEQHHHEPSEDFGRTEEAVRQVRHWGMRQYALAGALASVVVFVIAGLAANWQIPSLGMNVGLAASIAVAAALAVSLLLMSGRRTYSVIGYKGMVLSVAALAGVIVSVLVVAGLGYTGASLSQPYDNSMDALLSSYSLHWHIR